MSLRRSLAIARHDLRVLRRDAVPLILLIGMPLVLMPFIASAFRLAVRTAGMPRANGADQAVPGMAVTFAFFLVGFVAFGFFREHGWKTWDRLRASSASTPEILLGKVIVPLIEATVQFVVLFGVGGLLLGLHVRGSWGELIAVGGAFSVCLVTLGLAVTAVCSTIMQVNAITNISALLLAGLGGALVPESTLPPWAKIISPAVPSHWAMRGYSHAITGRGPGGGLTPIIVLLAFAVAFAAVAVVRLRLDDVKVAWA